MATTPPYLSPGDTIGIMCPSGFMPEEKYSTCIRVLKEWGYKVKEGSTLKSQYHYFSGTDEERLNDLQQMMDDDEVNAILFARGGYGLTRIIDSINFKKFKKRPKWIVGYSDITLLHCHILKQYKIPSLHAPMAAAFNDGGQDNQYILSLKSALAGKKASIDIPFYQLNKMGQAIGKLVGGNLSLLAHITGTKSQVKMKGKILFIEDIGEYIYHIDRMMYQLKRSGQLDELAGLIVGGFTDMKDTVIPYGKEVYEMINDLVKEYTYPVCYHFPVGHQTENFALKVGVEHHLYVEENHVLLHEV